MKNKVQDIDKSIFMMLSKKRFISKRQKNNLFLLLHKVLFALMKIIIAYILIATNTSINGVYLFVTLLFLCLSLLFDGYFLFNLNKLSNLYLDIDEMQHRRKIFDAMQIIYVFMDFVCMFALQLLINFYSTTNLLIVVCFTIILYNKMISDGVKSIISGLEKIIFPNRTIIEDIDNSRGYFWDRIFPNGRSISYFRILSIEKIVLLTLYIFFILQWLQYFTIFGNSSNIYLFIFYLSQTIIMIYNIWWYSLYLIRIWSISIYKDSSPEIEEKKKVLLLTERIEWILALLFYPIFVIGDVFTMNYIAKGEISIAMAFSEIKQNLPDYILNILIAYVFYSFNMKSIKSLYKETKVYYQLITLNIFKSWKRID